MTQRAAPAADGGTLAGSTAIVVLGAPRSGTSALTGALAALGVEIGQRLLPAGSFNPRGYWEHLEVIAIHDRLLKRLGRSWSDARSLPAGWLESRPARSAADAIRDVLIRDFAGTKLWAVKDPRLCRLVPLWQPLLAELGTETRYILALRHPNEVIASLNRRHRFSEPYGRLLWLRYVLEAEAATRGKRRAIVNYGDLLGAAEAKIRCVEEIARTLAVTWPQSGEAATQRLEGYLTAELQHERHATPERVADDGVDAVSAAFAAGDGPALEAACDRAADRLAAVRLRLAQIEQPFRKPRNWLARRRDGLRRLAAGAAERAAEPFRPK